MRSSDVSAGSRLTLRPAFGGGASSGSSCPLRSSLIVVSPRRAGETTLADIGAGASCGLASTTAEITDVKDNSSSCSISSGSNTYVPFVLILCFVPMTAERYLPHASFAVKRVTDGLLGRTPLATASSSPTGTTIAVRESMLPPKFEIRALDSTALHSHLRAWLTRSYPGNSLPSSVKVSDSLDRAPLDEHSRRVALFGHGVWAMLERDGRPIVLAGMAACQYDDYGPGFFTLEYDAQGRIIAAGYWTRSPNGNWSLCEGGELPPATL